MREELAVCLITVYSVSQSVCGLETAMRFPLTIIISLGKIITQ
jgi:hypothetical protein